MKIKYTIIVFVLGLFFITPTAFSQCLENNHSAFENEGWLSCEKSISPITELGNQHWILYDFGYEYVIDSVFIWNYNVWGKTDFGVKDIRIDYSTDKTNWINAGTYTIEQSPGSWKYQGVSGPTLDHIQVRYLLVTALNNWSDDASCAGISEIKFNISEETATEEEVDIITLSISPNPASEIITVDLPENINYIQIVNSQGQTTYQSDVKNLNQISISVAAYPDGIYHVNAFSTNGKISDSFVKINH